MVFRNNHKGHKDKTKGVESGEGDVDALGCGDIPNSLPFRRKVGGKGR